MRLRYFAEARASAPISNAFSVDRLTMLQTLECKPPQELSAETKWKKQLQSISCFRQDYSNFPLEQALLEHHTAPVSYALALSQLHQQFYTAIKADQPIAVYNFILDLFCERNSRTLVSDYVFDDAISAYFANLWRVIQCSVALIWFRLKRQPSVEQPGEQPSGQDEWQDEQQDEQSDQGLEQQDDNNVDNQLDNQFEPQPSPDAETDGDNSWQKQLDNLFRNVNTFCQHVGSELDDIALPEYSIHNLRKFAAKGQQLSTPLLASLCFPGQGTKQLQAYCCHTSNATCDRGVGVRTSTNARVEHRSHWQEVGKAVAADLARRRQKHQQPIPQTLK
jgi:hypothetical protein